MTLFLLSLTGIPPTAGFFAKVLIILPAVQAGGWVAFLAVLVVLNAAAAAFYYLRVVVYMYMRDPVTDAPALPPRPAALGRPRGRDRADDHPGPRPAADPRLHRPGGQVDHGLSARRRLAAASGPAARLVPTRPAARHPESCPMPPRRPCVPRARSARFALRS